MTGRPTKQNEEKQQGTSGKGVVMSALFGGVIGAALYNKYNSNGSSTKAKEEEPSRQPDASRPAP